MPLLRRVPGRIILAAPPGRVMMPVPRSLSTVKGSHRFVCLVGGSQALKCPPYAVLKRVVHVFLCYFFY